MNFEGEKVEKIRTEIFIETKQITLVKREKRFFRAYCEHCGREVSLLTPNDAAILICCSPEYIYSLMNANKIHFRYFQNERLFVCLTSVCLA